MQEYEKKHLKKVLKTAAECTVLLRRNGQFPLEGPTKIDAFGSGLRYTVKGGTGSGEVNSRFTRTIEKGLEKSGFEITSKKWLDAYDAVRVQAKKDFSKQLKKEAKAKKEVVFMYAMGKTMKEPNHELPLEKNADVAIYVLSRNSGEGSDREPVEGDVKLTESEVRDILALDSMYEKFMLVLNVGGVVDLSPVKDVGNILLLSQLGVDCGRVLAEILTGKQNPSGKLTTTWSAWEDYSSEGTFGDWNETRYKEGIYVGYRYFDKIGRKALFPFGYGLSYTDFEVQTDDISANADSLSIKTKVKNIGSRPGKEVVQVYVSMPEGRLEKPYQDLVAFKKTKSLKPGQEESLELTFKLSDFASYDEAAAAYILEKGDYIIRTGNSSVNTEIVGVASLDETITVRQTKNCLGKPDFTDISISSKAEESTETQEWMHFEIHGSDIHASVIEYDHNYEIDPRVKDFTDEELAYLAIGNFDPKAKGLSIIGNAGQRVAGAAGETSSQLKNKGIGSLVMSDGPAGIRVAKRYYVDETGRAYDASGGGMIPESVLEMMNPPVRFLAKLFTGGSKIPKHAKLQEHMATMIPIGTAIAQSFNPDLAKSYGDIVGSEMELFGIQLWLAPALNIHRSILCGRNFEYYSEDPLVSGLTAAAITEGVQSHKGCAVTIKHFAANNAETNRYCNNSQVSERAMREIYLRGFETCIRLAKPRAVMTSYNLLNGTHTSEHRGLIEDVLRREFGFDGIVMTDWVITLMGSKNSIYRNALSDQVPMAGGDLFMPGGKADYQRLLTALQDGRVTRDQLEINATRVIRMVEELLV
ncbi:MAG: glycoside hydrolase family 3 C-terminal domain-containing protein [Lachnospiraceae bacterium]|nr:glycoside hydrolase family 3 C-terminal domain-containing protein [Lachnospiraceae bacterium]